MENSKYYNRENILNSIPQELITVLLPSENMEAVRSPYSGTGRLQQKERNLITLEISEAAYNLYVSNSDSKFTLLVKNLSKSKTHQLISTHERSQTSLSSVTCKAM